MWCNKGSRQASHWLSAHFMSSQEAEQSHLPAWRQEAFFIRALRLWSGGNNCTPCRAVSLSQEKWNMPSGLNDRTHKREMAAFSVAEDLRWMPNVSAVYRRAGMAEGGPCVPGPKLWGDSVTLITDTDTSTWCGKNILSEFRASRINSNSDAYRSASII